MQTVDLSEALPCFAEKFAPEDRGMMHGRCVADSTEMSVLTKLQGDDSEFAGRRVKFSAVVIGTADKQADIFMPGVYRDSVRARMGPGGDGVNLLWQHKFLVGSVLDLEEAASRVWATGGVSRPPLAEGAGLVDPDGILNGIKDRSIRKASHGFRWVKDASEGWFEIVSAVKAREMGQDPLGFERVRLFHKADITECTILGQSDPANSLTEFIPGFKADGSMEVGAIMDAVHAPANLVALAKMLESVEWDGYASAIREQVSEAMDRAAKAARGEIDSAPAESVASVEVFARAATADPLAVLNEELAQILGAS